MTAIDTAVLAQKMAAVLAGDMLAKHVVEPDNNPFANHDLGAMTNAGLLKSADRHPALNMAPKGGLGYDMEVARNEAQAVAAVDRSAKRMAAARARAARKVELDKIADLPVIPSRERLDQAWAVVIHLVPDMQRIARGKQRWASRFLGSITDDVASMAIEKTVLMLAKSDRDLTLLAVAAQELGENAQRTGQINGDQKIDEAASRERRQVAKARKWLMGVAHNRVMGALVDAWTSVNNLRWDNIDIVTTVMANIGGVGEDPLGSNFKANRAPAFMGARFQRPDGIDPNVMAAAINAAITDRGLDPLVEFLLNDDHRRTDGAVEWSKHAETIVKLTPDGDGEWLWDCIVMSTVGLDKNGKEWTVDRASAARARAAREHVRSLFEFLPNVIMALTDSFDFHPIGYAGSRKANVDDRAGRRWAMASDFELFYLPEPTERRQMLRPVLRYPDTTDAALALIEHLSALVTGEDLVSSVVNA